MDMRSKQYLNKLIKRSGIDSPTYDVKTDDSNENIIDTYMILSGEIQAGNDNVELQNQLSVVLNEMVDRKIISRTQGAQLTKLLIADV